MTFVNPKMIKLLFFLSRATWRHWITKTVWRLCKQPSEAVILVFHSRFHHRQHFCLHIIIVKIIIHNLAVEEPVTGVVVVSAMLWRHLPVHTPANRHRVAPETASRPVNVRVATIRKVIRKETHINNKPAGASRSSSNRCVRQVTYSTPLPNAHGWNSFIF